MNKKNHKINQLNDIVCLSECDVCAITETCLNDNISDCELFSDEFTIYHKDRSSTSPGKRDGGVVLAVKKNLKSCRKPELEPDKEIIFCEIECLKNKKNSFNFSMIDIY